MGSPVPAAADILTFGIHHPLSRTQPPVAQRPRPIPLPPAPTHRRPQHPPGACKAVKDSIAAAAAAAAHPAGRYEWQGAHAVLTAAIVVEHRSECDHCLPL